MAILGLNISGFHSSACLLEDGCVLAAITEERLTRVKNDKAFPSKAIGHCLEIAGLSYKDITDVFVGWNPRYYMHKSDNMMHEAMKDRGKLLYFVADEISSMRDDETAKILLSLDYGDADWNIHFIDHHEAHVSNSFFSSGFADADYMVADGFGEVTSGMVGRISNKEIEVMESFRTPHSLGSFYSTFTEFLGFRPNSDEWKVMALASLGDPKPYYDLVRSLVIVDGLRIEFDLSYFEYFLFFTKHYYSPKFERVFGQAVKNGSELEKYHHDLVASLQQVVEDVVIELLGNLQNITGSERLVVSGGFFMNSVLNGKIQDRTGYKSFYVGGSPDDSGISIGSAFYGHAFGLGKALASSELQHNYFGASYENVEIEHILQQRHIDYLYISNIEKSTAKLLRDGYVIGWFQGRSEFGQRALGNRSILADPTFSDVKDKVNSSVKYREGFRPFAPAIMAEYQERYFGWQNARESHFMEKVFLFKDQYQAQLPGVVHFDGTGRLQTVEHDVNPRFHKLIGEFYNLSEHPVLLNTSFNVNGMPLVESPADAIDCFYQCGIDVLVLGDFMLVKKPAILESIKGELQ